MATLVLTKLWINHMATGIGVSGQSMDRSRKHSVAGKVETYAGGRQRSVLTVGEATEFTFTMVLLTEAQITQLRAWYGQVVEIRDHRGQRYVGTYYEIDADEYRDRLDLYQIKSTLFTLTFTDGV